MLIFGPYAPTCFANHVPGLCVHVHSCITYQMSYIIHHTISFRYKSMWSSHTTYCIIMLRLGVHTKVAAFESKNKMGSSHKLRSLANTFRIFRLSSAFHAKSKSCPRPIPQQDSSMLLQHIQKPIEASYEYHELC